MFLLKKHIFLLKIFSVELFTFSSDYPQAVGSM